MLIVQERAILRKRISEYIVKNPNTKNAQIVNHFVQEGYARQTVSDNIKRVNEGRAIMDQKRTGRPPKLTKAQFKSLKRLAKDKIGTSSASLAKKFKVHRTTIGRNLKKMNLLYYRRQKIPKYTAESAKKAKKRCRKLVNQIYNKKQIPILDDEKYFIFYGDNMPKNCGFYTDNRKSTPNSVKYKGKDKYPKKILVWIAISDFGMCSPVVRVTKSEAINQYIYLRECLQKKLLPFIKKNTKKNLNYLFWPDLARSHYAKSVTNWLDANLPKNVEMVPESSNPPNVPQARPIESFWGVLAQRVYDKGWCAKSESHLVARIKLKLKTFDIDYLQSLMKGVKTNLRKIADEGVFALFKHFSIQDD